MTQQDDQQLADRMAIQDVICAVTMAGDLRKFDEVYSHYTPDAEFDYTSLLGSAGVQKLDVFRENNMRFRPAIDTLHQVTNFQVRIDGDTAEVRSAVRAVTCCDDLIGENGGHYTHRLVRTAGRWQISYIRYDVLFRTGDDVFAAARRKMEGMEGAPA